MTFLLLPCCAFPSPCEAGYFFDRVVCMLQAEPVFRSPAAPNLVPITELVRLPPATDVTMSVCMTIMSSGAITTATAVTATMSTTESVCMSATITVAAGMTTSGAVP